MRSSVDSSIVEDAAFDMAVKSPDDPVWKEAVSSYRDLVPGVENEARYVISLREVFLYRKGRWVVGFWLLDDIRCNYPIRRRTSCRKKARRLSSVGRAAVL